MFSSRWDITSLLLAPALLLCSSAWAKPLVQFSDGQTRVTVERQISRGKPSIAVKVKSGKVGDIDIFTLKDPNRIVADIGSIPSKRSKEFKISESNRVQGVRLGTFDSKLRLVVDIQGDQIPGYSWIEGKQTLTLLVYDGPAPATAAKPSPVQASIVAPPAPAIPGSPAAPRASKIAVPPPIEPTTPAVQGVKIVRLIKRIEGPGLGAVPTRSVGVTGPVAPRFSPPLAESAASVYAELDADSLNAPAPAFPVETARASLTPDPSRIPPTQSAPPIPANDQLNAAVQPKAVQPPAAEPQQSLASLGRREFTPPSGPHLKAISFEYDHANAPVIKLKLSAPPQFNVSKTGLLEYKMTVTDCVLGSEAVGLPQFPPQDFEGFSVVLATQADDRIEVLIGVERGYRLLPTANGKEIWITAERMRKVG